MEQKNSEKEDSKLLQIDGSISTAPSKNTTFLRERPSQLTMGFENPNSLMGSNFDNEKLNQTSPHKHGRKESTVSDYDLGQELMDDVFDLTQSFYLD